MTRGHVQTDDASGVPTDRGNLAPAARRTLAAQRAFVDALSAKGWPEDVGAALERLVLERGRLDQENQRLARRLEVCRRELELRHRQHARLEAALADAREDLNQIDRMAVEREAWVADRHGSADQVRQTAKRAMAARNIGRKGRGISGSDGIDQQTMANSVSATDQLAQKVQDADAEHSGMLAQTRWSRGEAEGKRIWRAVCREDRLVADLALSDPPASESSVDPDATPGRSPAPNVDQVEGVVSMVRRLAAHPPQSFQRLAESHRLEEQAARRAYSEWLGRRQERRWLDGEEEGRLLWQGLQRERPWEDGGP